MPATKGRDPAFTTLGFGVRGNDGIEKVAADRFMPGPTGNFRVVRTSIDRKPQPGETRVDEKTNRRRASARHWLAALAVASSVACIATPRAAAAQDAEALRATQARLADSLARNAFGRPIAIASTERSDSLEGDVHAVASYPFATVAPALQGMDHWCDILILHLNVKGCTANETTQVMTVWLGRKFDEPLADAYQVAFHYRVEKSTSDYLRVVLDADEGPLGTKNYRIAFEATPIDAKSAFVHLAYSYAYGFAARVAMQGYLSTLGRDKVGFSTSGVDGGGNAQPIGGLRSVVERNAMRYFLAIDAYLGALAVPRAEQPEKRLRDWIDSTERYPRQLHEMDRDEYLAMKRRELARQKSARAAG